MIDTLKASSILWVLLCYIKIIFGGIMGQEKIGDIKSKLTSINSMKIMEYKEKLEALGRFLSEYSSDERTGVQNLIKRAEKTKASLEKELQRVEEMMYFEKKYEDDYSYICGVDEVGRGPLAGPIVTAAVILPKGLVIPYLNDSKQVPEKRREELYDIIISNAVAYAIGMRTAEYIDDKGISDADMSSMRDSVMGLSPAPDLILVDAFKIPGIDIKQVGIVKGDAKSVSIAAASIVAKVTRDRMMDEYDAKYPEYGFKSNKGYGSAKHLEAIQAVGPCEIHRRSFITKYI